MEYTTIISTDELENNLNQPEWVIIDCRFNLLKRDWGIQDYQISHIPGALYAHLDNDLSGSIGLKTGRHPLPGSRNFYSTLSNWGISSSKQVVVYDTTGGSIAVRLWWLLKFYQHQLVAVLNGGFYKWIRENRPTRPGIENPKESCELLMKKANLDMLITTRDLESIYYDPKYRLIDARAPERYQGKIELIDPVAGHIPGALNRFHEDNLGSDGTFKSIDQLNKEFSLLLGETPANNVIVYCGSGVTSCHHLLALEMIGKPGARLYAGSWSEWIRDKNHPIEKG